MFEQKVTGKARFVEMMATCFPATTRTEPFIGTINHPINRTSRCTRRLNIPISEEKVEDAEVADVTKAEDRRTWTGERTEKRTDQQPRRLGQNCTWIGRATVKVLSCNNQYLCLAI